jgi:adenylate cyclase
VRRSAIVFLDRMRLQFTMGLYFSPRVLKEVIRKPGAIEPRLAEVTLLLIDLRNFTSISEVIGPSEAFRLLNSIFEIQTRAVMMEDGSVEHFLGDQFLSYWGAPTQQPDAADRALRAALTIVREITALAVTLPPEWCDLFGFGVGIHFGNALIGNKGSALHLDYGLVGDAVNTAARVESLTRFYGVPLVITKPVLDRLTTPVCCRLLDRIRPKGKNDSIELYEVCLTPEHAQFDSMRERYEAAWRLYSNGDFERAAAAFEEIGASDPASRELATRSRRLATGKPLNWDGTFAFQEK